MRVAGCGQRRRGSAPFGNVIRSCGALGLTTAFDLHMWTMRIRASAVKRAVVSDAGGRGAVSLAAYEFIGGAVTAGKLGRANRRDGRESFMRKAVTSPHHLEPASRARNA